MSKVTIELTDLEDGNVDIDFHFDKTMDIDNLTLAEQVAVMMVKSVREDRQPKGMVLG